MNGFSLRSPLWIGVLLVMLVTLGMGGGYLYLKGVAARNAVELAVDWNPDHTCSIKTYAPSLGERSGLSRLFHHFQNARRSDWRAEGSERLLPPVSRSHYR